MRPLLTFALSTLLLVPGIAQAQVSLFRGADVYRSQALSTADLNARYGALLDSIGAAISADDMDALGDGMGSLARQVRASGRFAFVDLSPIQYFQGPDTTAWYLTVDVVDSLDVGRLRFDPEPVGQVEGLDSLLAQWRAFEAEGFARRAFWTPEETCPALHCVFSFQDSALAHYEPLFREGATSNFDALEQMIRSDADAEDRATAAFVIAHAGDQARVGQLMVSRLHDPSSLVRNNVMRVLAFMVRNLHATDVPVEPFLSLIDGPSTTDRNKALAVLDGIVTDRPSTRTLVRDRAGDTLLQLLALKQPNNHGFAYSILQQISGQDFGARDIDAWRRWLASVSP